MYKTLHNFNPEFLRPKLIERNDLTSFNLRNNESKLVVHYSANDFQAKLKLR